MTLVETEIGLTNIFKRLAYSYLCKGVGEYDIVHDLYDKVRVSEMYPWGPNPVAPHEYAAGLKVEFFHAGERVRWAEFNVKFVGGGGDLSIFLIKS